MTSQELQNALTYALQQVFISPNESDRNAESANVVDGLFAIARGLQAIAKALESSSDNIAKAELRK